MQPCFLFFFFLEWLKQTLLQLNSLKTRWKFCGNSNIFPVDSQWKEEKKRKISYEMRGPLNYDKSQVLLHFHHPGHHPAVTGYPGSRGMPTIRPTPWQTAKVASGICQKRDERTEITLLCESLHGVAKITESPPQKTNSSRK